MTARLIAGQQANWIVTLISCLLLTRAKAEIVITLVTRYGLRGAGLALVVMMCVLVSRRL